MIEQQWIHNKNKVCIGLLHENCYLVEGGNKNLVGYFFLVGGWASFQFLGGLPGDFHIAPVGKTMIWIQACSLMICFIKREWINFEIRSLDALLTLC